MYFTGALLNPSAVLVSEVCLPLGFCQQQSPGFLATLLTSVFHFLWGSASHTLNVSVLAQALFSLSRLSYMILPTIMVPCVWTVSIIDRSFLILYISVVEWTPPCGVLWAPKSHGIQKGTRDHGYFPIFSPPPVSIVTTQARHLEVILPLSPCSSSVTTFCLYNS